MSYSAGLHPHIRSGETVQSLTWTAAACLIPAAVSQLFFNPELLFTLLLLFFSSTLHEEITFALFRPSGSKKYRDFKNGTVFLFAFLFLLMIPASLPAPAAAAGFFCALFLGRSVLGGQGAPTFHPVLAGVLFLGLSFQGMYPVLSPPAGTAAWLTPGLLGLGGVYAAWRGILRPQVPAVFLAVILTAAFFLNIPIEPFNVSIWLLAAFFIVTDSVTTPLRMTAHCFFALAAALLTALLEKSGLDAATSFAIAGLSANAMTPWLDAVRRG